MRSRTGPPTARGRSMMLHARECPHPGLGRWPLARAQFPVTVTVPMPVVALMTCEEVAACGTVIRTAPTWVLAVTRYAVPDGTRTATEPVPAWACTSWGGTVNPALIMPAPVC